MIFFNVSEAREQLMTKGLVYTLRATSRTVGRTKAVTGGHYNNTPLCTVEVEKVMVVVSPEELHPYVEQSGFKSVEEWISKAGSSARHLYKVVKSEGIHKS